MIKADLLNHISKLEEEKITQLLECNPQELETYSKRAEQIFKEQGSNYEAMLKILQQGCSVREATLIGMLVGMHMGFDEAVIKMEEEIKNKLYDSFKRNA
jgi:dsDNA-specific endonuclease/ATPase MutS2